MTEEVNSGELKELCHTHTSLESSITLTSNVCHESWILVESCEADAVWGQRDEVRVEDSHKT